MGRHSRGLIEVAPQPCLGQGARPDAKEGLAMGSSSRSSSLVVGFQGQIVTDCSKPDGTLRKLLNTDELTSLGWQPKIDLKDGLARTCEWFADHVTPNKQNVGQASIIQVLLTGMMSLAFWHADMASSPLEFAKPRLPNNSQRARLALPRSGADHLFPLLQRMSFRPIPLEGNPGALPHAC